MAIADFLFSTLFFSSLPSSLRGSSETPIQPAHEEDSDLSGRLPYICFGYILSPLVLYKQKTKNNIPVHTKLPLSKRKFHDNGAGTLPRCTAGGIEQVCKSTYTHHRERAPFPLHFRGRCVCGKQEPTQLWWLPIFEIS